MKQLFKNLAVFFIPLVVLVTFIFGITLNHVKNAEIYIIPKDKSALVAGHSHASFAFNDTIIKGVYNVAQRAEGYPYTFFKLKKIFKNNTHIKKVYLEVTNNQLSSWSRNRIWGLYFTINQKRTFVVQDDLKFILKNIYRNRNLQDIFNSFTGVFKENCTFILNKHNNYIAHQWHVDYPRSNVLNRDSAEIEHATIVEQQEFFNSKPILCEQNLEYLVKIRDLCNQNNIRLVFIRSPLPKGINYKDELFFQWVLTEKFKNIEFLDFKNFPLSDSCFADVNHLNSKGRVAFSHYFEKNYSEL